MNFSIPIYIEESSGMDRGASFAVRPLFQTEPIEKADKVSRALTRLSAKLQELLLGLGREPRHDRLADWTFCPPLEETTLELRLELASGSQILRVFLVGYPALGRKLYFTPPLPGFQFELLDGQSLLERATAVYTRFFRDREKEDGPVDLKNFSLQGKGRLTTLDLTLTPAAIGKKPASQRRAFLFGDDEKKDGEEELRKTGQLLNSRYPEDLERAIGRQREVEELARLLASTDRRPTLLVGPRKVGKTTIIHELVWQMCARKKERFGGHRQIWQLSPMRLISGMSYLGEWENRVLAILDYAQAKDRVLYFDDLPGLLTAGVSSASDLNVAQVLRPVMEKQRVRIIAEITPESWNALRERDRTFADLFHVIPINESTESETLQVLVNVTRQLEDQYNCEFGLEVVPAAYELHRRFAADAAFPGKAAGFLRRLAVRFSGSEIDRKETLEEFHQQSGLRLAFLDQRDDLTRTQILESLRGDLVGQGHCLDAFADILVMLKARLNDPRRPLGTMLLLGPTGVGKTQSAKALARFLFGSAERMLRFDMNEFVEGTSVARLAGSTSEPDGLLTGAVRRQPFSVVLFDEIEKAAPEVFDLLLAVLDEGRLVDSMGRVADFTNAVILLTSNLGARESRSRLGFGAAGGKPELEDAVYISAAEKFFRPEFFNRIDRIIPFRNLERGELEGIARQLIANLFARDGLRRRDCMLKISPMAMARLIEMGRNPQLGARALKRVIEREVAQPIALRLAAIQPGTPMIANFMVEGDRFVIQLHELHPVERSMFWHEKTSQITRGSHAAVIDGVNRALERIETELETMAPGGRIELGKMSPAVARYFACREQLKKVEELVHALGQSQAPTHRALGRLPKAKPVKVVVRQNISGNPRLDRWRDRVGMQIELAEWEAAESVEVDDSPVLSLFRELALLEALARKPYDDRSLVFVVCPLDERDIKSGAELVERYRRYFEGIGGASASRLVARPGHDGPAFVLGIYLTGFNTASLALANGSTVLVRRDDGSIGVLALRVLNAASLAEAESLTQSCISSSSKGNSTELQSLGPVLQMMISGKTFADFRTGLEILIDASPDEFRALMLSALPLSEEVIL